MKTKIVTILMRIGSAREEKSYKAFKADVFIRREEKVNHLKVVTTDNPNSRDDADMADDESIILGDSSFNDRKEADIKGADLEDEDEG